MARPASSPIRLNLAGGEEARAAAGAMIEQARAHVPDARIKGFAVQPMIHRPGAHELILGIADDRAFGPVVLFGAGGTSVEVAADKALALAPLDLVMADDFIRAMRIGRLLKGYRDRPAADRGAIALALVRLAQIAAAFPEIRELDVNPLLADHDGIVARIAAEPTASVAPGGNPGFVLRPHPSQWAMSVKVERIDLRIRSIRPEDEALYATFFQRLATRDLHHRFFGLVANPAHAQIARFTQIDCARAMAFVELDADEGELLGVARLAADPDYARAVIVRSDVQGRGVGRALRRQLIDYARAELIGSLYGNVLSDNHAMLKMCRGLGFTQSAHPEVYTLRRVCLATG